MARPTKNYYLRPEVYDRVKAQRTTAFIERQVGMNKTLLPKAYYGEFPLNEEVARRLSDYLEVEFEELFEPNIQFHFQEDPSQLVISERVIVGIRENIAKRLSVSHSIHYVNEIVSLLDDLIIESSYFGAFMNQKGKDKFIKESLVKRFE